MASAASLAVLLLLPLRLLLPLARPAHAQSNINLGSSLTADDRSSPWKSLSGDFAFGFQKIGDEGFLLAIWFNKIPEKTVIWSANGGNLAPQGSKVELTREGRFALNDPKGEEIWAPMRISYSYTDETRVRVDSRVSHASMLDTGNFVLVNGAGDYLWGSFNEQTDTIVPTQVLDLATRIVSRYSATNYSTGRFVLNMQSDGNLVMLTNLPVFNFFNAYWSTVTINTGYQVIFNRNGQIYVTARDGTVLSTVMSRSVPAGNFYQRAILEYDGVFRQYVYPRNSSVRSGRPMAWSTISSPVPGDICMSMRQSVSGGACGFNSYCILGADQRPRCQCPPGYSFMDPSNDMNGCKKDFLPQSCEKGMLETDKFMMRPLINTDWPFSDYEHYDDTDEDSCRQDCLSDCFCDVAIYRDRNCWKKRMPLSNGRVDSSVRGVALIKTRIDNTTSEDLICRPKKEDNRTVIIVGSAILSSSEALNLIPLILTFLICFWYNRRKKPDALQQCPVVVLTSVQSFTYKKLQEATGGFKEELGRGAFGAVYKGVPPYGDRSVAVKVLEKMTFEGEREFKTEVSTIGRTNHRNLVELIGFCNEGQDCLLVYEFMPNGSLSNFLFGGSRPGWFKRIEIACGIARGLLYLHEECTEQIIHCDIKPQNILLDESFTAKICDFGLAKLLMRDQTRTVRGTKEYLAPEWFRNMPISAKVDVYSFGIVLLELICCRKNCKFEQTDETQMNLSDRVYDCYYEDRLDIIVEGDEDALNDMRRVRRFVMIAMCCIQEHPSLRPTMKEVVLMLEGAVEVSIPRSHHH